MGEMIMNNLTHILASYDVSIGNESALDIINKITRAGIQRGGLLGIILQLIGVAAKRVYGIIHSIRNILNGLDTAGREATKLTAQINKYRNIVDDCVSDIAGASKDLARGWKELKIKIKQDYVNYVLKNTINQICDTINKRVERIDKNLKKVNKVWIDSKRLAPREVKDVSGYMTMAIFGDSRDSLSATKERLTEVLFELNGIFDVCMQLHVEDAQKISEIMTMVEPLTAETNTLMDRYLQIYNLVQKANQEEPAENIHQANAEGFRRQFIRNAFQEKNFNNPFNV